MQIPKQMLLQTLVRTLVRTLLLILFFSFCYFLGGALGELFSNSRDAVPSSGLSSASKSWGLSYQEEGKAPVGNESPEALAAHQAYYVGSSGKKAIYLTFDCGYENGNTGKILDTLKEKEVPAAFFLTGDFLASAPELARRMVKEGHIAGNHTDTHPDMTKFSSLEEFQKELTAVETAFHEITGSSLAPFYRPPQGIYSDRSLEYAKEAGYHTIFWSLAHVDWNQEAQPSWEEMYEKLVRRIHPGAIVLLHSTSQANTEYLGRLIDEWKTAGYRFGKFNLGRSPFAKDYVPN